jgi:hypothetical protein
LKIPAVAGLARAAWIPRCGARFGRFRVLYPYLCDTVSTGGGTSTAPRQVNPALLNRQSVWLLTGQIPAYRAGITLFRLLRYWFRVSR